MLLQVTYWGLSKMITSSRWHFQIHFLERKCLDFDRNFSLKFVCKSPTMNISALVKVVSCCITGDKSLSKLMMTQFTDAYTRSQWVNKSYSLFLQHIPVWWYQTYDNQPFTREWILTETQQIISIIDYQFPHEHAHCYSKHDINHN